MTFSHDTMQAHWTKTLFTPKTNHREFELIDVLEVLILMAVGTLAGWLNVMAGGGSLLTVPTMLFLGLPGPVANGTNRIAILAQNVVAAFTFFKKGYSDFKLSFTLAMAAIPGAILGASVGTKLDGPWFDRLLALIMIVVMVMMMKKTKTPVDTTTPAKPKRLVLGHIAMVAAGFWGGLIQIGVGFILMPILHRILGLDLVRVNMHKVFIVLVYTIVALIVFASQVELAWLMGAALAVGNATGGWLGARTTIHKGDGLIRGVLITVLSVFVVKLLFFS